MLVASAFRQAASLVSPLNRCPTINAGSPGLFQLRFRHFSDLVGFSYDSPAAQPTSQTDPQFTEVFDASFFKKSFNIESLARNYQIEYDPELTGALCALRDATEVPMEDGFSSLKLKDNVPFFSLLPLSNILFIRRWYAAYFATLRKTRSAVLLGNPGIAKSTFQAYYIYRCMQSELPPDDTYQSDDIDTNSPAYKTATKPPRVIIRQVGTDHFQIYCLEKHVAFRSERVASGLLYSFNQQTTEYLFEPAETHKEPFFAVLSMPTKASCSPDKVRYKEFVKNGAVRVYMPCWEENELLMAGKVLREHHGGVKVNGVDYSDEAIQERFKRFGGIFGHVLPSSRDTLIALLSLQTKVLKSNDAEIVLSAVLPTIEHSDLQIPRVSDMLMQYDVDENTFEEPPLNSNERNTNSGPNNSSFRATSPTYRSSTSSTPTSVSTAISRPSAICSASSSSSIAPDSLRTRPSISQAI